MFSKGGSSPMGNLSEGCLFDFLVDERCIIVLFCFFTRM